MISGIIIKGIGGFYYVDVGNEIIECKARGHFRNKKMSPCVGDYVDIEIEKDGKGSVCAIHPRKNSFIRPPVSNIDAMIVVASVMNPVPDLAFIDKMIIIAQMNNVNVEICFNKNDLGADCVDKLVKLYQDVGYKAYSTSTISNTGIELVKDSLDGRITAFSGFSGVGKSSLLNAVLDNNIMETGEVSERLKRGKHTTRHVELIPYKGGYIVDTPGFSMLDFPAEMKKDMLKDYFPEFSEHMENCRFRDCNHLASSSVCAVCEAVEKGEIPKSRYENYKNFYSVLGQRKEW